MERPSVREQNLSRYLSKNLRLDPHNLTLSHVGSEASIDGTAASDGGVGATARVTHRRLEDATDTLDRLQRDKDEREDKSEEGKGEAEEAASEPKGEEE